MAEANAPHIETVQTALRTAEKEAVLPYTSMQAFPSEIQAEDIHDNLARRTAARHKLAEAVAPLRDYSPRTIENDEILANLGQISRPASLRRQVRHTEAAAERWARKQAATEAVAPQPAVPATPSRPKPAAPVKKSPYISPTCRTKRNRSRAACRTGRPDGENRYSRAARFPNLDCAD